MTLREIEKLIDQYPWFTLARRELFLRMADMGKDHKKMGIRRAAGYVYSRERMLKELEQKERPESVEIESNEIFELDFGEIMSDVSEEKKGKSEESKKNEKEIFIIGGDYFKREDFESVPKLNIKPEKAEEKGEEEVYSFAQDDFGEIDDDELFYTESLARVYTSQGFYKRAIDIYEKLILLYPEKNIYFASLIEKIKKNT